MTKYHILNLKVCFVFLKIIALLLKSDSAI